MKKLQEKKNVINANKYINVQKNNLRIDGYKTEI